MSKTVSLRLNSEEEEMLRKLIETGISPTKLLRNALQHYVKSGEIDFDENVNSVNQVQQEDENSIDQKSYEKVNPVNKNVNLIRGEVNLVNKDVNTLRRGVNISDQFVNTLRRAVNIGDKSVNTLRRGVNISNENVNTLRSDVNIPDVNILKDEVNIDEKKVNMLQDKFLSLYIDQLNTQIQQLESEIQQWRVKSTAEDQYLKNSYTTLQTEFFNQTRDSIKRLDDKFDRIMFYLEESKKPSLQSINIPSETKKESDIPFHNILKISKKKHTDKPKKGWVFQMYRM